MNTNNILNLPFDEGDGSLVAYDYSQSRADGDVTNAAFVAGKNGNAIKFTGNGYCELSKDIFATIGGADFSILFWLQSLEVETGSPTKGIWVLNFGGLNNFVEVPIALKPGSWYSVSMTRRDNTFTFYVNSSKVATVNRTGTLQGVSLNQDYYGGDLYGLCLMDDVKVYNIALSQAEIIEELASTKQPAYRLDGVDFKEYGVYVSGSRGILNRPKMKAPAELSWDNYHGKAVDLYHKYLEPREITLDCFIRAESKNAFITAVSRFQQLFDKRGTNRLTIDVHPVKPLIYEVYCQDVIDVSKTWNDALMVGTFQLKLIEPEPVKRILKHIRISEATKTCSITMTTAKTVNIYWGDGSISEDVCGTNKTITHDYAANGEYYPVITGCIDEIVSFNTNAIVMFTKI